MIIPFFIPHSGCPHRCVFCNQKNITGHTSPPDASLIPATIKSYLKSNLSSGAAEIAFYGGTFTALRPELRQSYLESVQPFLLSGQINSIRLSTRPDCISPQILKDLKIYHVETVELGVQSMDDKVLACSGRGHTSADTISAVRQLRDFSFRVGLQLMPGLPGDSEKIWTDTVGKSIDLKPEFVRIYPALVIKNTPLEGLYRDGVYIPLPLQQAIDLCKGALLAFDSACIKVIRIGLQPTEELEKPGTILAGPFHPAFRQLVESSIMLDRMSAALSAHSTRTERARFFVHPSDISNAIGQKHSNVALLKKRFGLKKIALQPDERIPRRRVTLAD